MTSALPRPLVERVLWLRDRLHPFESLEPTKTALVVVDLQNTFVAEGAPCEAPAARGIVDNVNTLSRAVRDSGGVVVWVQMSYDPDDRFSTFFDHMLSPERAKLMIEGLTPGNQGHELWPALELDDRDLRVCKTRFSAFLPTSSDIAERLRDRDIDTVLITGTVTNTCCESSARDAMMMDFKTVMVSDANAGIHEEVHQASLRNFLQVLGDVRSTEEVVALLAKGAAVRYVAD